MIRWLAGAAVVALAAAVIGWAGQQARAAAAGIDVRGGQLLLRPDEVPGMDFGVPGAVATLVYLNTVADYGTWVFSAQARSPEYQWLAAQLAVLARLDPHALGPAEFAGTVLNLAGRLPVEAHEILLRAIVAQPNEWRLYFWLGAVHMFGYDELGLGAEWMGLAGTFPGAPPYVYNLMQLVQLRDSGRIDRVLTDLALPNIVGRAARGERRAIERFLALRDRLEGRIDAFVAEVGRPPRDVAELVDGGYWLGVPRDPWGGRVRLGPQGRTVLASERVPIFGREVSAAATRPPELGDWHHVRALLGRP